MGFRGWGTPPSRCDVLDPMAIVSAVSVSKQCDLNCSRDFCPSPELLSVFSFIHKLQVTLGCAANAPNWNSRDGPPLLVKSVSQRVLLDTRSQSSRCLVFFNFLPNTLCACLRRDTDRANNMYRVYWCSLVVPLLAPAVVAVGWNGNQEPLKGTFDKAACPDYASYAAYPQ
jgi:hypothetical protein